MRQSSCERKQSRHARSFWAKSISMLQTHCLSSPKFGLSKVRTKRPSKTVQRLSASDAQSWALNTSMWLRVCIMQARFTSVSIDKMILSRSFCFVSHQKCQFSVQSCRVFCFNFCGLHPFSPFHALSSSPTLTRRRVNRFVTELLRGFVDSPQTVGK